MTARTRLLAITVAASLLSSPTFAQNELPPQTLFTNVHVWDGTSEGITKRINVLIEHNTFKKIRAKKSDAHEGAIVIDAPGMTLMLRARALIDESRRTIIDGRRWSAHGALPHTPGFFEA